MPDRSAVEAAALQGGEERAASASNFYVVEVRRTPGALGWRAAARAVEEAETRRFASLVELCRFLQSTAGDAGPAADDSCGADAALRGAA
jgi:hypothetical protein